MNKKSPSVENDSDRLRVELSHMSKLEDWKSGRETDRLMLSSVMTFGVLALKSAILINGGAAIACLTFLGNTQDDYSLLAKSLGLYVLGVLLAGVATAVAYISQSFFTYDEGAWGDRLRFCCIVLVFSSYAIFGISSFVAYKAFSEKSQPVGVIDSVTSLRSFTT